jgi:hypothetical protein
MMSQMDLMAELSDCWPLNFLPLVFSLAMLHR